MNKSRKLITTSLGLAIANNPKEVMAALKRAGVKVPEKEFQLKEMVSATVDTLGKSPAFAKEMAMGMWGRGGGSGNKSASADGNRRVGDTIATGTTPEVLEAYDKMQTNLQAAQDKKLEDEIAAAAQNALSGGGGNSDSELGLSTNMKIGIAAGMVVATAVVIFVAVKY